MKIYERINKHQIRSMEFTNPANIHRDSFDLMKELPDETLPDPDSFPKNQSRHVIYVTETADGSVYRLVGGKWLFGKWY